MQGAGRSGYRGSGPVWQPRDLEVLPTMPADPIAAVTICEEIHAWEAGGAESMIKTVRLRGYLFAGE